MKMHKFLFCTLVIPNRANWITKEWQLQNTDLNENDIRFRPNKNTKRTWEDCGMPKKPKAALKIVCSGYEIKQT